MFLILIGAFLNPQSPGLTLDTVRTASTSIRTIDTADEDFGDLEFLRKKIGSSRIVMLGEASHGDGSTFLAKTRIIKFLHKEMGFDVLAWEAGLFDCREMDRAFRRGESPFSAGERGLFSLWSYSKQIQPLLAYVASTQKRGKRLEVAGFDHQISSPKTSIPLARQIIEFFDEVDSTLLSPWNRNFLLTFHFDFTLGKHRVLPDFLWLKAKLEAVQLDFQDCRIKLSEHHGESETRFMERCLRNVVDYMEFSHRWFKSKRIGPDNNFRDFRMADNLRYLTEERYRNRKIIVWAANSHNSRKISNVDGPEERRYGETIPMGEVYDSYKISGVFSLAFVCNSGKYGIFSAPFDIKPAPIGSLENHAYSLGSEYLFIDASNLPNRYVAGVLGHVPMMGDWSANFDGFIYLREMKPNTMIELPSSRPGL